MKEKTYRGKTSEMLLAAKTIAGSFLENIVELEILRADWDQPYANDLLTRIEGAINQHLGLDIMAPQRDASRSLFDLLRKAKRYAGFVKTQILDMAARPEEAEELLNTLGYQQYWKESRKQQDMIDLLELFKTNLSPAVRQKIEALGVSPAMIDEILQLGIDLRHANEQQEALKSKSLDSFKNNRKVFQDIYAEIILICKLAYAFYDDDQLLRNKFSYSHIHKSVTS